MEHSFRAALPLYIGLGANLGDPSKQLEEARISIHKHLGPIARASQEYLSEPWGDPDQPWYRNQVILVETSMDPEAILQILVETERNMGRERSSPNAARIIDLDILFYGDQIIHLPKLTIPHPRVEQRNFVLIPMMEIAPDFVDPRSGKTIEELYLENQDLLEVYLPEENL